LFPRPLVVGKNKDFAAVEQRLDDGQVFVGLRCYGIDAGSAVEGPVNVELGVARVIGGVVGDGIDCGECAG
jgi:hypothetical protein